MSPLTRRTSAQRRICRATVADPTVNGWLRSSKSAMDTPEHQRSWTRRKNKMAAKSQAGCIRRDVEVEADPRWARVLARDRSADGQFWYSVATTGVYCRPSCPSRTANPRNVGLHASLAEAKATGFRPCKRCNPDGPSADIEKAAIVARVCRLIEESEAVPSLKRLAQASDLSTSHFHRLFKSVTGLTPKDYAEARRASRLRDSLST